MAYKRDRMLASTMEGYCAPFSRSAIRYCMGEESENEGNNIIWGAGEMLAHEETEAGGTHEKPNNHKKENDVLNSFKKESSSNDSVSSEYVPSDAETGGEEEEVSDKRKKVTFDVEHSFYKAKITKSAFGNVSEQTNPQHQGNCLLLLPCSYPNCLNGMEQYYAEAKDSPSDCDSSMDSAQDTQAHFPKSFLFHVIGQQLTASPFI